MNYTLYSWDIVESIVYTAFTPPNVMQHPEDIPISYFNLVENNGT